MANHKKYIVGNWKSNKTLTQVEEWFNIFHRLYKENKNADLHNIIVVVCPAFPHLFIAKKLRDQYKLPIEIGAQDISPYSAGAYTGAVSSNMIKEFAGYVIIGHSERRKNFLEDDHILTQKVTRAKEIGLTPIYCVPDKNTYVPKDTDIVAYEPVWAIGTGKIEIPEKADEVALFLKNRFPESVVLYGGSVSPDNIGGFSTVKNIDGFLPGGASLDPQKFWEIIVHASIF